MAGLVPRLSVTAGKPRSSTVVGRRPPRVCRQGLDLGSAFRFTTFVTAKQEDGSRRKRRASRDHGGERPLRLHSHFSVHSSVNSAPSVSKYLQSHRPAVSRSDRAAVDKTGGYRIKGWQTRGWSAFADHDGIESEACQLEPDRRRTSPAMTVGRARLADQPDGRRLAPAMTAEKAAGSSTTLQPVPPEPPRRLG
jgi:hypothetical protein